MALAVALLGLIAAGATLLTGDREAERAEQLRASALEAARERTVALTTYDHRTLDEDFAGVLERATGEFEQEYTTTTGKLRATFEKSEAIAVSEVKAAGLESVTADSADAGGADRAVAVVAVDQTITTAGAAPRTERNRLRMVLVRPEDTWLVERVQRL